MVLHIECLLAEREISKNRLCKELDIPRSNLNRYCRGDFRRIDVGLICKLCWYLEIEAGDLIEYVRGEQTAENITTSY